MIPCPFFLPEFETLFIPGGYDFPQGGALSLVNTISLNPSFPSCALADLPIPRSNSQTVVSQGMPVMCGGAGLTDECYGYMILNAVYFSQ